VVKISRIITLVLTAAQWRNKRKTISGQRKTISRRRRYRRQRRVLADDTGHGACGAGGGRAALGSMKQWLLTPLIIAGGAGWWVGTRFLLPPLFLRHHASCLRFMYRLSAHWTRDGRASCVALASKSAPLPHVRALRAACVRACARRGKHMRIAERACFPRHRGADLRTRFAARHKGYRGAPRLRLGRMFAPWRHLCA